MDFCLWNLMGFITNHYRDISNIYGHSKANRWLTSDEYIKPQNLGRYAHTHTYIYTYINLYMYIYIYTCICVYMYICVCIYVCRRCVYVYVCICVCIRICLYIYIYVWVFVQQLNTTVFPNNGGFITNNGNNGAHAEIYWQYDNLAVFHRQDYDILW